MGFRLVPKSVTLNDLEQHNSRYFALLYVSVRFQNQLCHTGLR